jgi:hypothetical protein
MKDKEGEGGGKGEGKISGRWRERGGQAMRVEVRRRRTGNKPDTYLRGLFLILEFDFLEATILPIVRTQKCLAKRRTYKY